MKEFPEGSLGIFLSKSLEDLFKRVPRRTLRTFG